MLFGPSTYDETSHHESMQSMEKAYVQVLDQVGLDVYHFHCLTLVFD